MRDGLLRHMGDVVVTRGRSDGDMGKQGLFFKVLDARQHSSFHHNPPTNEIAVGAYAQSLEDSTCKRSANRVATRSDSGRRQFLITGSLTHCDALLRGYRHEGVRAMPSVGSAGHCARCRVCRCLVN